MDSFNPQDLQNNPGLSVLNPPSAPSVNRNTATASNPNPPPVQLSHPVQPSSPVPVPPSVPSGQGSPPPQQPDSLIPKAEAQSPATPAPPQKKSSPVISADQITTMRKTMDDTHIANSAYQSDPQFKALVDHLYPYMKSQGTENRLPTFALNNYYNLGSKTKLDTGTKTMLNNMVKPPAVQAPWFNLNMGNMSKVSYPEVAHAIGQTFPIATGIIGGMAGGVLTAPSGPGAVAGAVGGAGLGYAGGAGAARALDEMTGYSKQLPPGQELAQMGTDTAVGALSELGGQATTKVLEKAGGYIAENMSGKAGRIINSLIKPVNNEFKFGKNPGQAIVDEGITGKSLEDLGSNVFSKVNEIGSQIQSAIESASAKKPVQIDVTKVINDAFAPAIKEAGKLPRTGATQVEYLKNLQQDLIDTYGGTHTPLGVFDAKQAIQDQIHFNAADPFNGTKNEALWNTFSALKDANNEAIPGLSVLNDRYSNLVGAKASIARRVMNASRANVGGLVPAMSSMAAGGATFAETGDLKKSAMAAGLGLMGTKAIGSTLVKTNEAQIMAGMPAAVKSVVSALDVPAKAAFMHFLSNHFQSQTPQSGAPEGQK